MSYHSYLPKRGDLVHLNFSPSAGHEMADRHYALVLSPDTLVRFVPAIGFSGTPGSLDVHALDDTYTGGISAGSPVSIDITSVGIGHGGTTPVSDQAAIESASRSHCSAAAYSVRLTAASARFASA